MSVELTSEPTEDGRMARPNDLPLLDDESESQSQGTLASEVQYTLIPPSPKQGSLESLVEDRRPVYRRPRANSGVVLPAPSHDNIPPPPK